MTYIVIKTNGELYHHGIKGQRWGYRRFQNEDGSLTAAGRQRYLTDVDSAKKEAREAKANYNKLNSSGAAYNVISKAKVESDLASRRLENEKIKERLNKEKKVSKSRQQAIDKYKGQGLSQEEAEIAAYKNARTKKIIAIAAATAVTAAAAYAGYKYYQNNIDKKIKADTVLQNISRFSDKGVNDAFYASMTKSDNNKYRGMYGKQILDSGAKEIYETKMGLKRDLKIASPANVQKALKEGLKNDPDLQKELVDWMGQSRMRYGTTTINKKMSNAYNKLKKGIVDKEVYEAMNISLTDHNGKNSQKVFSKFYGLLKNKGYDAIMDVNDMKYSGYNSKKPVIVFNGAEAALRKSARVVSAEEIKKTNDVELKKLTNRYLAKEAIKGSTPYASLVVGAGVLSTVANKKQYDIAVNKYRKQHPGTQLSYDEIVRNLTNK